MIEITLKGRKIPLLYTTLEMKQIQEEVVRIGPFMRMLFGKAENDGEDEASLFGGPEQLNAIGKCIRILGNAGLEEAGEEANLTDKWVMRALKPSMISEAMITCMEAINDGLSSEIPPAPESGEPVDVTLEDIEKKSAKEG